MNYKKITLGLAAFLMVGGLAACGGEQKIDDSKEENTGGTGTTTTINVWADQSEHEVINAIVAEYNKNATDKIEVVLTNVGEDLAASNFATDPVQKNYPALLAIADDQLANLVKKGYVAEIPAAVTTTLKNDLTSLAITGSTVNDKLYGYPVQADNGYILYYDGDALGDDQVTSIESILSVCKEKGKKFYYDIGNGFYSAAMFLADGVAGKESLRWVVDEATEKNKYEIGWDTDACVAAAQYLSDVFEPAYTNKVMLDGNDTVVKAGFGDGSIIAGITGGWNYSALNESVRNLKATRLPSFKVGGAEHIMGSFAGTKLFVVNAKATSAEQMAALRLGNALVQKDAQLLRYTKRAAVPCNKAALADQTYTENVTVFAEAITAQAEYAAIQATSAEARYWDIGKAIGTAVQTGNTGGMTWKEYLKAQCDVLRAVAA